MRKLYHVPLLTAFLLLANLMSAAVLTILPGNGSTSGNGRAPQGSRTFINTLYYITPSEMTTSGYGSDQVTSVGWTWQAGTPQNTTTTGNLKVYLQNSADLAYSKGSTFSTVGMTKVIDGTITITNSGIQFSIDVAAGGPGTSVFNTVAGQGLYIAFEYQTTTTLALPLGAPTVLCNNVIANSLGTYQSNLSYGTLMTLSAFRPETRLGNPLTDYSNVMDVYCLGAAANPYANPLSLEAKIKNESASAQNFDVTFTVQEKVTATVRYTNTATHSFLAGEVKTVSAPAWTATINELDTVICSVTALGGETVTTNNSKGYRHRINTTDYGYADAGAATGGVGFGAGSGQILNKYTVDGCVNVEAVKVYVFGVASIGNTIKAVVNDATGVQIGASANHVVAAGDVDTWITLPILVPPGISNADFLVGIEQSIGVTAYFPVGTQTESSPTRNNAFYSNSVGGGALFGPYTTLNRWMIEGVVTPLSSDPVASGPATACEGEMITLSASFTELSPSAVVNWYSGSCGGTLIGTGTSIMIAAEPGTNTYYVRAEDACNNHTTACDDVTVTSGAAVLYFADADGDSYGDPADFVISCTGAPTGYVLDGSDCDDTNSAVNPGATEICNGIDDNCDGNTDEGVVEATITAPGGLTACKPNSILLQTTPIAGYTYQWFKNGSPVAGAINPTFSTNKPAYYTVQVNTPEGCFDVSDPVFVTVAPSPNANISAPNGTSLCATVKLKASYDASYTWQWEESGTPIPGATDYLYFPATPGSYTCVVTNSYGCSRETSSINVTACREGEATVDGSMQLYPNPATTEITIQLNALNTVATSADIVVMNMLGEIVVNDFASVNNNSILHTLSLGNEISGGMYLVRVMVDGTMYQQQLIISR